MHRIIFNLEDTRTGRSLDMQIVLDDDEYLNFKDLNDHGSEYYNWVMDILGNHLNVLHKELD